MFEILEEVVHAFNPNTWEAAADRSLNLKLAWPIAFQDSQGYKEKKKSFVLFECRHMYVEIREQLSRLGCFPFS